MDGLFMKAAGIHGISPSISVIPVNAVGRSKTDKSSVAGSPLRKEASSFSRFSFRLPLRSLWPRGESGSSRYGGLAMDDAVLVENGERKSVEEGENGSWVMKILQVSSLRKEEVSDRRSEIDGDEKGEECDVCGVYDYDVNDGGFDRDSFSRFLRRVSMAETKLYAQICYLGDLAYCIDKLKPGNLLKYQGLRFVTSSLEKKESAAKAEKEQVPAECQETETNNEDAEVGDRKSISAYTAYGIAASAASYLHSHTKSIGPFNLSRSEAGEGGEKRCDMNEISLEMASLMATTDSVTAVVAAKEEVKQAVADELNSNLSSPCEWFICDDDQSATRFFVIQGSESLASWQANLLFEPIKFEGLDVLVHRGIYEAAKGMYEQMLPEVRAHLKSHGKHATFRFTGHSLGGSLSLLVNLMLLIRGEVPRTSLLPVIMFGAPSIMCGGDRLLEKLGLPRSHVQAIMMHRDIVPRVFSCNYPNHVAELLKAVNGNFRNHPCLKNQKQLYAPMGELLILQPDERLSPHHHLLPSGSGLYLLNCLSADSSHAYKQLLAAKSVFINSPHPLEILSDRSAYGSEGTIRRDHDMNSYLKSVRSVIRQELNQIRKAKREQRRKIWWPLVTPCCLNTDVIAGSPVSISRGQYQFNFSGILQTEKKSLKRFSRLVTSQHLHLLIVFLFPARLLLLGGSVLVV